MKAILIEAAEPPEDIMTLRDFIEWRRAEDERIKRVLLAQIERFYDEATGKLEH